MHLAPDYGVIPRLPSSPYSCFSILLQAKSKVHQAALPPFWNTPFEKPGICLFHCLEKKSQFILKATEPNQHRRLPRSLPPHGIDKTFTSYAACKGAKKVQQPGLNPEPYP